MILQPRRRKGSGDLPGLQSRRFGPSRVEWWIRLPHASAKVLLIQLPLRRELSEKEGLRLGVLDSNWTQIWTLVGRCCLELELGNYRRIYLLSNILCAAESPTRFPWIINTTLEEKIYIRWCCIDRLSWHNDSGVIAWWLESKCRGRPVSGGGVYVR